MRLIRKESLYWLRWICAALLVMGLFSREKQAAAQTKFITEYLLEEDTVEIPFEYVQHQILIKGEASDKKDLTFLFDSGATLCVLDKSLGLGGYHIADSVIQEAEGSSSGETVWLDDMRTGPPNRGVHVHNIAALLTDISQISKFLGRKIDGIIGLSFMSGYVIEVDYAKKTLRFLPPRRFTVAGRTPDNQIRFLFDLVKANPKFPMSTLLVEGKLTGDYDYNFILDTGFGGYVSVAQSAAQQSGLLTGNTPRIAGSNYSFSHEFRSDKIRASYLMLGEINLSNRVIQIDVRNKDAFGQVGIVGNRFLQNYRLTMDFPRHKLWMERATSKEEPDEVAKLSFGMTFRTDGGMIRVAQIARYSPADRAGFQVGDVLNAIDEQSVSGLGTSKALNLLAAPNGALMLEVQRTTDASSSGSQPIKRRMVPLSPLDWKVD